MNTVDLESNNAGIMTTYKTHYTKEQLFELSEKGNSDAMYSIGYRYLKGMGGLPQNNDLALEWFKKAADAGNRNAMNILKNTPALTTHTTTKSTGDSDFNLQDSLWSFVSETFPAQTDQLLNLKNHLSMSRETISSGLILILFLAYLIRILNKARKAFKSTRKIQRLNKQIEGLINQHVKALALKYRQTVRQDEYGNIFYDQWDAAVGYFIKQVLCKKTEVKNHLIQEGRFNDTKERITRAVKAYEQKNTNSDYKNINVEQLSPIDFEHYCADILKANGWKAKVTQASSDQGIDIIAQYKDIQVAFQCKKYSNPVGNKAVQEIIAGKQYIRADIAAVISNARYTASAKQLADSTGVHLLHYSELKCFKDLLLKSVA